MRYLNSMFILFITIVANIALANPVKLNSINYDPSARIRSAVKSECDLPNKLSQFIIEFAKGNGITVSQGAGSGRVLDVKIVEAVGAGGGAWSGAKGVKVVGKLIENGKVIGSFDASRFSGGGFFAQYKGTCSILGRCVKALGRDIGNWLVSPTMNDVLGDGW